ncbi:MAG: hypothetical protein QOF58_4148 [Pseudonocardiales bacterium]|nr:hypothetical protein [Pseudonocardiales bacterium]
MVKLVVVTIVLALIGVLTPVGHAVTDCATAPRKSSSQSQHDPVKHEPKKEDPPRQTGEKNEALRQVPSRRAVPPRPTRSWTRVSPPPSAAGPAVLDDIDRVEHLSRLARPAVLQVFRN